MDYFDIINKVREASRPMTLGFCGKIPATALPVPKKLHVDPKTGRRASISTTGVGDFLGIKTFTVNQTHIKKAPGLLRCAVTTMGLQVCSIESI
eukprot:SAG11_NODE_171_length_13596_cov_15.767356_4_plen_94_part_00